MKLSIKAELAYNLVDATQIIANIEASHTSDCPFCCPADFVRRTSSCARAARVRGPGDGVARIMAMPEWIHRNVDYVARVSNAETTAERTFVDRAGVCRDFTHLGITFARAL